MTTALPPVPKLDGPDSTLVPAGLLKRSYPAGRQRFLRAIAGEALPLRVELLRRHRNARLSIFTNACDEGPDAWRELAMEARDGAYCLDLHLPRRGTFAFRLKVSLDDGKTWHWDRMPATWVMVDPPRTCGVKLYTLIPTASGTWEDWRDSLPAIRDLGCNLIHLLPLTCRDVSLSPYAAADLFALDPAYVAPGDTRPTLAQFQTFVEEAARLELGLCIDLVFNHVGIHSVIARKRPEWLVPDDKEDDGFKRAGWEGPNGWNKWQDLGLLHYGHPHLLTRQALWDYMLSYCRLWAGFAHRTGGMVRLDNLHSSHEGFTRAMLDDLRSRYPDLAILAELFASQEINERLVLDYGLNLMLGTQWEHHFAPDLRRYLTFIHERGQQVRYYLPISTHDSGTPTEEFGDVRSTVPRYAISCFYGHGMTGLTQGVEYGVRKRIHFIGNDVPVALAPDTDLRDTIRTFHDLLDREPIFHRAGNLTFIDQQHAAILGAWRGSTEPGTEGFVLLTNLDILGRQSIRLEFDKFGLDLTDRRLEDLLSRQRYPVVGNILEVTLPPCGVMVLHAPGR